MLPANFVDVHWVLFKVNQHGRQTCDAIYEAAKVFAIRGELRLHVFSNTKNPKIPGDELHDAVLSSKAKSITTDPGKYEYLVSKNDNSQSADLKPFKTNHHVAIFDL